ncbi:hypothetical protein L1987_12713 [Smallanthus sonchifolius]|uniref:Uncharacterized protein n=1 Tax=Smallanthus sonchifolius TaxID=185202 RepID=A0ACB9JHZ9_9ASTR|nr:hypothetical protein L1987_12713 [Smallanthus sonchifolius]
MSLREDALSLPVVGFTAAARQEKPCVEYWWYLAVLIALRPRGPESLNSLYGGIVFLRDRHRNLQEIGTRIPKVPWPCCSRTTYLNVTLLKAYVVALSSFSQ